MAPDPLSEPSLNLKSARTREDSSLRKAKKRTIPDDFILTPDRRGNIIAAGHREGCSDLNPDAFFAHFAEKCRKEGYTYSNWDRALVEWCKREGPKSPFRTIATRGSDQTRWMKDVLANQGMSPEGLRKIEEAQRALMADRRPGESIFDVAARQSKEDRVAY